MKTIIGPHRNEMCDHWMDLTEDCLACEIDHEKAERRTVSNVVVLGGLVVVLAAVLLPWIAAQ